LATLGHDVRLIPAQYYAAAAAATKTLTGQCQLFRAQPAFVSRAPPDSRVLITDSMRFSSQLHQGGSGRVPEDLIVLRQGARVIEE
jgi:hypothetical protein